jgi:hypothetical protein
LRLFPPDGEAAAGGAVAGTGVALTAK